MLFGIIEQLLYRKYDKRHKKCRKLYIYIHIHCLMTCRHQIFMTPDKNGQPLTFLCIEFRNSQNRTFLLWQQRDEILKASSGCLVCLKRTHSHADLQIHRSAVRDSVGGRDSDIEQCETHRNVRGRRFRSKTNSRKLHKCWDGNFLAWVASCLTSSWKRMFHMEFSEPSDFSILIFMTVFLTRNWKLARNCDVRMINASIIERNTAGSQLVRKLLQELTHKDKDAFTYG